MDDVAVPKPVEQPRLTGEPQDTLDAMKIAWRYQNLPKVQVIDQCVLFNTNIFPHTVDQRQFLNFYLVKVHHVSLLMIG